MAGRAAARSRSRRRSLPLFTMTMAPLRRRRPRGIVTLTDIQKGDLAALWERHAPDHHSLSMIGGVVSDGDDYSNFGNNNDNEVGGNGMGRGRGGGGQGRGRGGRFGRGRGRGGYGAGGSSSSSAGVAPQTVVAMSLEDEDYIFICRLYSFFRWIIVDDDDDGIDEDRPQRDHRGKENHRPESEDGNDNDNDDDNGNGESKTWEALSFLFQKVRANTTSSTASSTVLPESSRMIVLPRIIGGKNVVTFNHTSFLEELRVFEGSTSSGHDRDDLSQQQHQQYQPDNSSSFGYYLHHKPDRALTSLGCAIGLIILTLWRRHQSLDSASNNNTNFLQPNASQRHPQLATLHTALYHPRFYNLSPSMQVRMAHIRTSTVGHLISLRGTVTKARPKRLRVLDAGFTCSKCGLHQITKFVDGKYTPPSRCVDIKCRSVKFVLNRRVANFCDVQELKIQEVREELWEDEGEDTGGNYGVGSGGMDDRGVVSSHGGDRDAGRAPRHMEVEVTHDLVDACHAGDSIVVCGIVRAVNSAMAAGRVGGKRAAETSTYKLYVVGHSIVNMTAEDGPRGCSNSRSGNQDNMNEWEGSGDNGRNKRPRWSTSSDKNNYTDQQLEQIVNLAHADHRMYSIQTRMAFSFDLLVRSLCPGIIGNDLVKAGIVLCLLGGTPPEVSGLDAQSGIVIRSNSHMLIVGDPGMGKSQMLLAANQVAARSVYVGGNTTSSTGLTVSLTKEPGGDMGIEAGALVLADRGVCCLDELDKMPKTHQDGLLEAMEQQQVSIAKAGIVASLPSRCSVIAAANPKSGHYNMGKSVGENINLAGPLLSRFDLVFILRDQADTDRDRMISGSIMGRLCREGDTRGGDHHHGGYSDGRASDAMNKFGPKDYIPMQFRLPWVTEFQKQPLPLQQVKDYIAYAREYCRPKMTAEAAEVLQKYFMYLR